MRRKRIDTILKRRYLNAKNPASYAGAYSFYDNLPDNLKKRTTRYKTLKILQHIKTYCQNRPAPRRFRRRPIVVPGIDSQWAIDLADIPKLAKENGNVRYLFMCLDVLSKFGWIVAMKKKTAAETLDAFKKVLEQSGRKPGAVHIDNGTEYKGVFKRFCDTENIRIIQVHSEIKSSIVERWIRTIMERLWRYMQHHNTFTYVDILPKVLENYNGTRHRSTKFAPKDVNEINAMDVWMNLYGSKELKGVGKPKFSIGNKVLISIYKDRFVEKGYEKKFHDKVYIIDRISNTNPYMYYLKSESGEPLEGGFYDRELSRIYI